LGALMISLLLRNLLFTILQPGLVAVLFPYLLLKLEDKTLFPNIWTIWQFTGIMVMFFGFFIMIICILRFATEGKGTLSPIDPTKKLVVKGLYRYSRNPMYVGVISLLLGETVFWQSFVLAVYAVIIFIGFSFFIIFHEEPRLKRDFGTEYEQYFKKVSRWF
jgi:protein-S-isoprenylcysteine O-methyltransferase Ste14